MTGNQLRPQTPKVILNDENTMPVLGFGVAELSPADAERSVSTALAAGCRLIDTAEAYGNESAVGRAIAGSGLTREELFVTNKLAIARQGYSATQHALRTSLERLDLEYVDLYLIHWPAPQLGLYVDSFRAMEQLRDDGLARSIGVSNFTEQHLDTVIGHSSTLPAVNQIELHPLLSQAELRTANTRLSVITQAYSPLAVGQLLDHPTVTAIAGRHHRSPAQVLVRWNIQLGNAVVFGAANPDQIAGNLDVFDFTLNAAHINALNALNRNKRLRADPNTYTGS